MTVSRRRSTLAIVGLCSVLLVMIGCEPDNATVEKGQPEMSSKSIEQVLQEHTAEWMEISGVVGTGIGACEGEPCIRVFVVEKTDEIADKIPSTIEGYTVEIVVSGRFEAR
jgi:hypothetical protein